MQNAQIWKSIEALCDEAEAVIKDGTPMLAVIQSTAPPAMAHQQSATQSDNQSQIANDGQAASEQKATNDPAILTSKPAPPMVNVVGKAPTASPAEDAPLSPATMAEIAAAIDRAGKTPKTQIMGQEPQPISDQLRRDLMAEIGEAIRISLANELPRIVHHAVSESLYAMLTTSASASPTTGSAETATIETKPARQKAAPKKAASPKTASKRAASPKTASKKAASPKTAGKKAASPKTAGKKATGKKTAGRK